MAVHHRHWKEPSRFKKWLKYSDHEREMWIKGVLDAEYLDDRITRFHCSRCIDAYLEGRSSSRYAGDRD